MSRPWMPLYVADYLADTAHLSTAEHGAYLLLIMHYWAKGSLPDDDVLLARIVRMTRPEWSKAKPTLKALFQDGWKHKRIEFELTEAARISEAGRIGGKASGKKRRENSEAKSNDRSTIVERSANDSSTKREALQPQSQSKSSEANASGAVAPVYTDSKHELWGEGIPILRQLGVSEREARSNVGRWLKASSGNDAVSVLGAIQRARDHRVIDPIPWITRALNNSKAGYVKPENPNSLVAAGKRRLAELDRYTRELDEAESGEGEVGLSGSHTVVRMLSAGGSR